MIKFFLSVYGYFSQRRGRLFVLLILLAFLFAFSAYHISFKEDIARFLPENKENERINNAYQYVISSNTITIYCNYSSISLDVNETAPEHNVFARNEDTKQSIDSEYTDVHTDGRSLQVAAIDALAERLHTRLNPSYIKSLFYSVNPIEMLQMSSFVIDNMPYFLEEDDYSRMDTLLSREAIARQLGFNKNILSSAAGMLVRNNFLSDPLQMTGGLMRKLQNFQVSDQFHLYDDHLFDGDNQAIMFIDCAIPASETGANAIFLDSLKILMAETEKDFAGIMLDSFGASEIGLANARQIQKDTMFSMSLAVVIMLALMVYSFRNGRKIALIFASVVFGGLFALAALHLISGDISIIAVGISSIMFGIAINYPLHFITYHSHAPNMQVVIKDVIEPLTIGNLTTVGAFLSLVFIGSDAMKDLGLFAALLLVGTILFVLFFLPHLLPTPKRLPIINNRDYKHQTTGNDNTCHTSLRACEAIQKEKQQKHRIALFLAMTLKNNRNLSLVIILLTLFFSFFSGDSRFETNMQNINYMTDSHKKSFEKMMGLLNKNQHVMYYVTEGRDLETVLEASENSMSVLQSLVDDGEIYRIGGVGNFFPSRVRQATRIQQWEDFWSTRRDSAMTFLREEAQNIGFNEEAFRSFITMVDRKWETVDLSHFSQIKETLARNYIIEKNNGAAVMHLLYMDASKAPELEQRLNESDQLYRQDVYSIAFDAGSVMRRMVASLSDHFNYVLYVCGFIVFTFLLFTLGRIELTLIAFLPLALSWIWILGMMNIFDIRFNIVNIILATFIFGQGDDYTILMTEGLMHEYAYSRKILTSYKKSIVLSATIMFVGMGMLIFAKHPALRSLAEVTIIGMFSVVIMAYILPSQLFRLLTMKKGKKRGMPVTLKNLSGMIYAFLYFLIMSLVITFYGWIMFSFGRPTEKKKRRYHQLLYRIANFVVYHIPQVKTTYRNLPGETFDKPGVIICNHQSHLDLMCIMMLTPKLIILTNDWVWNSPFYGRLIKYLDFYPLSNGVENAIDKLQDAINRGYSIVVFPEGTRSPDCSINRFHRGPFYLAEQLKVDVIPVMIHGVGHVLPKEDFMLRKGQIHIQVMPRITPDDPRFSNDYSPRSRDVRHYYQEEYKKLCKELETPDYYADLVLKNYLYKGPAIAREVRRNLKKHNNYTAEIAAMPDTGETTIQNTGSGEYALLLSLVKKDLRITVVEPDPDRRALAENCVSVPVNLRFVN